MRLRRARQSDAEEIFEIAAENSLSVLEKDGDVVDNGFLVSGFQLDVYKKMIKDYEHFYVIEQRGSVRAFMFAYGREEVDKGLAVNQAIAEHADGDFLIIKQVCVARRDQSKGFGSAMYEYFLEKAAVPVYAAIVEEPYNEASVHFHRGRNFYKALSVKAEDEVMRMVFCHDTVESMRNYDSNMLEQQYQVAVDLYLHEDNLNWSKLNNLFYISGGLVAVISILASLSSENLLYSILIVSVLGIISSVLFSIAITSGVHYMNNRKQTVMSIEKLLISKNGTKVVLPQINAHTSLLRKSPTSKVMVNIPRFILSVWIGSFFITLFLVFI